MSTNQEEKKEQPQDEKKEESIFNDYILERVIVSIKPLPFYIDRARRALRVHEEITVIGFDGYMSSAATVVETLKRQKIAHIKKIETAMDIPLLNANNFVSFARPVPKIVIHLRRGDLAPYLSGFYQRKIVDLFETLDKEANGRVSYEDIMKLDMTNAFHATDEQKQRALKEIEGKSHVTLPDFIRFASHCIHPKLRDDIIKDVFEKRYGIRPQGQQRVRGGDGDGDTHDHDDDNIQNNINKGNNHNDEE